MNKKIVGAVLAIIILAGIAITFIFGLNFDLIYKEHKQLCIKIGQEFQNEDVQQIVKDVVGNKKIVIKKVELYKDMASIELEDITDEQLETLNTKINEKYKVENDVKDIVITTIPKINEKDLIKPYILPIAITFILFEAYLAIYVIIYNKSDKTEIKIDLGKALLEFALSLALVQALYLSVLAIVRIPVNNLTIPIAIVLFITTGIVKFIDNKKEEK